MRKIKLSIIRNLKDDSYPPALLGTFEFMAEPIAGGCFHYGGYSRTKQVLELLSPNTFRTEDFVYEWEFLNSSLRPAFNGTNWNPPKKLMSEYPQDGPFAGHGTVAHMLRESRHQFVTVTMGEREKMSLRLPKDIVIGSIEALSDYVYVHYAIDPDGGITITDVREQD